MTGAARKALTMGDWDEAIAPMLEHPRCPLCDEGRLVEIIYPGPFYFCQCCGNQWAAYLTARALAEMKRPES